MGDAVNEDEDDDPGAENPPAVSNGKTGEGFQGLLLGGDGRALRYRENVKRSTSLEEVDDAT
jgi:hypothetical protein